MSMSDKEWRKVKRNKRRGNRKKDRRRTEQRSQKEWNSLEIAKEKVDEHKENNWR